MAGMRFLEREEPRTDKHHSYSPEDWEILLQRAREWTRETTREHERFFQYELREALGIGTVTARRVVGLLVEEGWVVHRGSPKLGFAAVGVVRGSVTLEDLVEQARAICDKNHHPKPGPRTSRRVEVIGGSQLKDIETTANFLARNAGDGTLASVDDRWFGWDDEAGDSGGGEWAVLGQVEVWADEEYRARCEAKGKPFVPAKNAMRHKLVDRTKLLLDLAATAGLIERDAVHTEEYAFHAAEWQRHIEQWTSEIMRRSSRKSERAVVEGCRTLALYATRRGKTDPSAVNWDAIRTRIEEDRSNDRIRYRTFTHARWVYNKLRKYKRIKVEEEWKTKQHQRRSLVTMAVIRSSLSARDFSEWKTADGKHAEALTEGAYGMTDWVRWCRAKNDRELRNARLPLRTWPNPTPEEERRVLVARKRNKQLFKLSPAVMRHRLQHVALVAGWAESNEGIDWTESGLDRLVDPGLLEKMAKDLAHEGAVDEDGDPVSSLASQIAFTLATLASPYLEARALREGDSDLAAKLKEHSNDLKAMGIRLEAERKKHLRAIVDAWDAGSGKGGWGRLEDLRAEMIAEIERLAGGLSLEVQVEAIDSGDFRPSMTWAVLVRDACMVSLLRVIPLRGGTLVRITRDMWFNDGASAHQDPQPWEGGIQLRLPKRLMKGRRKFQPFLFRSRHVGDAAREADLCRPLWQLYFMAGGAREEVLRYPNAENDDELVVAESPYIFPALARRGGGHGTTQEDRIKGKLRWKVGSASAQFSRRVLQFAGQLGMNVRTLEDLWGATSLHVIRLLFGTHWANEPGMLKAASLMLHHSSTITTEKKYCALNESDVDLFANGEPQSEEARLRAEVARLRAQLVNLRDVVGEEHLAEEVELAA